MNPNLNARWLAQYRGPGAVGPQCEFPFVLYDTIIGCDERFFCQPVGLGKTYNDTNMVLPQTLPAGQLFLISSLVILRKVGGAFLETDVPIDFCIMNVSWFKGASRYLPATFSETDPLLLLGTTNFYVESGYLDPEATYRCEMRGRLRRPMQ